MKDDLRELIQNARRTVRLASGVPLTPDEQAEEVRVKATQEMEMFVYVAFYSRRRATNAGSQLLPLSGFCFPWGRLVGGRGENETCSTPLAPGGQKLAGRASGTSHRRSNLSWRIVAN